MLKIRKSEDRGRAQHGWLDSHHSFSFGNYYDPAYTGFRDLLVINEDRVAPGGGFGMHGHADMEILSYVLEGELQHKDSLGTGSIIRPGEIQRMSAGSGIQHSEFNASKTTPVHFLQIWITPAKTGMTPSYEQQSLPTANEAVRLDLIAGPEGTGGTVALYQDAKLYRFSASSGGEKLEYRLAAGRGGWLQIARGRVKLNELWLDTGDGLAITDTPNLTLEAGDTGAEALLFDLR